MAITLSTILKLLEHLVIHECSSRAGSCGLIHRRRLEFDVRLDSAVFNASFLEAGREGPCQSTISAFLADSNRFCNA
jgi:hypothetical protein